MYKNIRIVLGIMVIISIVIVLLLTGESLEEDARIAGSGDYYIITGQKPLTYVTHKPAKKVYDKVLIFTEELNNSPINNEEYIKVR